MLAALLCALASHADGQDRTRFDLLCSGMGQDGLQEQPQQSMLRISVDLDSTQFCIEEFCDKLTSVTKDKLQYQCDVEPYGLFCESRLITSTAGPIISHEDFIFDRASGHFSRTLLGDIGDIISRPYHAGFSGTCAPAPYTAPKP